VDEAGLVQAGLCPCQECRASPAFLRSLGREALRWGEYAVAECPHGCVLWAVAVTDNNALVGSLLSGMRMPGGAAEAGALGEAALYLRQVAIEANLTNAALLRENREAAAREASKAQAIHSLKEIPYASVREVYLREEVGLIAAIKTGEKGAAREILNRILVSIYALAGEDIQLLKALVLELVVVIYRTAVEAGGDPVQLLGLNFASLNELSAAEDEVQLTHWLVTHLERFMERIYTSSPRPVEAQVQAALRYMQEHCTEPISRDDVAQAAMVSPSHLSHMLRAKLNTSYVDLLNEMRLARARELLIRTDRSLLEVALASGFSDQSYFTKVFRRYLGCTPSEYRTRRRQSAPG
jgi:AraC-like DNA-binding protein